MEDDKKPLKTIVMRLSATLCFITSAIVIFKSYQKTEMGYLFDTGYFDFVARYMDWGGLMFLVVVNCIGIFYNFLVVLIPTGSQLWKMIIFFDVVMLIVLGAALGAGWQTYILINLGSTEASWVPICGQVRNFCSKILGSLIMSTLGFVIAFTLLLLSLHVSVDPFLTGDD